MSDRGAVPGGEGTPEAVDGGWVTIDWDAFGRAPLTPDDRDAMCRRGHDAARLPGDLFAERGVPDSVAVVGCGAGVVRGLIEAFRDTAPAALEPARETHGERTAAAPLAPDWDLAAVTFEAAALPDPVGPVLAAES